MEIDAELNNHSDQEEDHRKETDQEYYSSSSEEEDENGPVKGSEVGKQLDPCKEGTGRKGWF